MPYSKGQSGNPKGRPKLPKELTELARSFTPAVLEALARTALEGTTLVPEKRRVKSREPETGKLLKNARGQQMYHWEETGNMIYGGAPPEIQIKAQEILLERALGKAIQPVSGPEMDQPLQIDRIERIIIHASDPPMKEINARPQRERIINGNGRDH